MFQSRRHILLGIAAIAVLAGFVCPSSLSRSAEIPARVILDAHNCYPYNGEWSDRIQRALGTGLPVAIEQDLVWYRDPKTGRSRSIVSHGESFDGNEPSLEQYFFETIRPKVENALREQKVSDWPLIILNLDFKTNEREHIEAVSSILAKYEAWLTTAPRTNEPSRPAPLDVKPVLVLTGDSAVQESVFSDAVPIGGRIRAFGAVQIQGLRNESQSVSTPPEVLVPRSATNYRRWWNNPWRIVEAGGPPNAGEWTKADRQRLAMLVQHAHARGYWIRFYTLNGHAAADSLGWDPAYNFGSIEKAKIRWRAAIDAGVDFIATDQYEAFARVLHGLDPISPVRSRS